MKLLSYSASRPLAGLVFFLVCIIFLLPAPPVFSQSTANQVGRLTSSGNGQRRTTYEYDALGRPTQTVHKFDGQSKTFTLTYGYPQNPATTPGLGTVPLFELFPDNERVDYTYDASGAPQSIKTTPFGGPQQTIISSVLRNARGQTIQVVYGNLPAPAITIKSYNDSSNLRLNQIKTTVGTQTLQDYSYSFDHNGNVTGVTDAVNSSLTATYGYDSLDQLTSMFVPSSSTTLTYSYDPLGNLTNKEGVIQTYGGLARGPHALATAAGVSYDYDLNGNLVSTSNGTSITWNSENMATRVTQNGVTMNQKSFLGESLWKKVEPGVTTFYLPSVRIENGQYRKLFGSFAERSPDGTLKFYHGDHLGSASLVTDLAGAPIRRQAYKPYGEDRAVSGSFTEARYQFNFKEKETTGFYDYGARLYNPATGRWLSADKLTTDGVNRYAYVRNNPLKFIDPTGHQSKKKEPPRMIEMTIEDGVGQIKYSDGTSITCAPQVCRQIWDAPQRREKVIDMISTKPQPPLKKFDSYSSIVTTPIKKLGIEGWEETGLYATGAGLIIRPPFRSWGDEFWTVDVRLVDLSILGQKVDKVSYEKGTYYLRLEVKPGTAAHKMFEQGLIDWRKGELRFEGSVKIDHDSFLEIHPNKVNQQP